MFAPHAEHALGIIDTECLRLKCPGERVVTKAEGEFGAIPADTYSVLAYRRMDAASLRTKACLPVLIEMDVRDHLVSRLLACSKCSESMNPGY